MTRPGCVLWRFVQRSELLAECGPLASWLSEGEQRRLAAMGSPASREASALARVALKQLVLGDPGCSSGSVPSKQNNAQGCHCWLVQQCGIPPRTALPDKPTVAPTPESIQHSLELVSHDALGRGVRPRLLLAGRAIPWSVSVSHTETAVLVAISTQPGLTLGVDLVAEDLDAARSLKTWFDPCEEELVAAGDPSEALRLWAIKEAVYKATNQNDSFAPRRVCIRRTPDGQYQATYRGLDLATRCRIATRALPGHVAAFVQLTIGRVPLLACPAVGSTSQHGTAGQASSGTRSVDGFVPLVEHDSHSLAHEEHSLAFQGVPHD